MRTLTSAVLMAAASIAGATPAPEPPRPSGSALIFFDWGKPDLNPDAATALDAALNEWRARPWSHIRIAGYSDRSGSAQSNLRASRLRANAVRAYFEAHGVPAAAVSTVAFGEEHLLVETEDGVREPQNRRVEVLLSDR